MSVLVGRAYIFTMGELKVRFRFNSDTEASFVVTAGAGLTADGHAETVAIELVELEPGLYLNSWREASGTTVTHVEDFRSRTLHSLVTLPTGDLVRMTGTIEDASEQDNKQVVLAAMHELFVEKDLTALDRYWREPYTQHSPQMPSGLDTLRSVVPGLNGFEWRPQRLVAEGDLVIAHSRVQGWGDGPKVIADIFRLDEGKIVEHWDVVQDEVPTTETASGIPMV